MHNLKSNDHSFTNNYMDFLLYLIICALQGKNGKILMKIQVSIGEQMILLNAH